MLAAPSQAKRSNEGQRGTADEENRKQFTAIKGRSSEETDSRVAAGERGE
jgi:hypothetical protein